MHLNGLYGILTANINEKERMHEHIISKIGNAAARAGAYYREAI